MDWLNGMLCELLFVPAPPQTGRGPRPGTGSAPRARSGRQCAARHDARTGPHRGAAGFRRRHSDQGILSRTARHSLCRRPGSRCALRAAEAALLARLYAVAIVTLALGIGANTAIFTLVEGFLLRSLPVADPARLFRIGDRNTCCYHANFENPDGDFDLFSYDLYLRFKQAAGRRSLNSWRRAGRRRRL